MVRTFAVLFSVLLLGAYFANAADPGKAGPTQEDVLAQYNYVVATGQFTEEKLHQEINRYKTTSEYESCKKELQNSAACEKALKVCEAVSAKLVDVYGGKFPTEIHALRNKVSIAAKDPRNSGEYLKSLKAAQEDLENLASSDHVEKYATSEEDSHLSGREKVIQCASDLEYPVWLVSQYVVALTTDFTE